MAMMENIMRRFPIRSTEVLRQCILVGSLTSGILVGINAKIAIKHYGAEDQTNSDRLLLLLSFYRVISYIFRLPILYIMCNSYSWVITAPDRVTMVDRLLDLKNFPIFRLNGTASNMFYVCFALMCTATLVNVHIEGSSWMSILNPLAYSISYQQSKVQRPPFAVPTTRMHTNELNLSANTFQSCVADPHPQSSLTIWCGKRFYDISVTPLAQQLIDANSTVVVKGEAPLPERTFVSSNCAICYEDYVDGDALRVLRCGHMFHRSCIDAWLTKQRDSCPLCGKPIAY